MRKEYDEKLNKKCCIVVSSCDSYKDLWDPFFILLSRYWPDCPYNIYINTESVEYSPPINVNLRIKCIHPNDINYQWGGRMFDVLQHIKEEYVFLLLDDFFIQNKFNYTMFYDCLKYIDENVDVCSIQFHKYFIENKENSTFIYSNNNGLELREVPKNHWKCTFVPTIWRKNLLISRLRKHESIWGFENYGSKRVNFWKYKEKTLGVYNTIVYDYFMYNKYFASAVINGKWLAEKEVDDFFAKEKIIRNMSRGTMTFQQYNNRTFADIIKRYNIFQIIERCISRIRSLF